MSDLLKFFNDKRLICQLGGGASNFLSSPSSSSSLAMATQPDDPVLANFYQKLIVLGLTDELEERLLSFAEILTKMKKMKISASVDDVSPMDIHRPGYVDLNNLHVRRKDADLTIDRGGKRTTTTTNKQTFRGNPNLMVKI